MSKVLYIKANAKSEGESRTFRIADRFLEEYKRMNPLDEISILDLSQEKIHFLSVDDIATVYGPKTEESKKHPVLQYTYQFAEADKYIVAAPMWNLSIPAILKAYIDYITVTGLTFKYTEKGAVGLLMGKKAIYIVTRGGGYSSEPESNYEMGERYLRTAFGFLGITDFTSIAAEKLDVIGEDVEAILNKAIHEAVIAAKTF
ncbi:FMN-dependent NADH-azoreductase [Kineothrix alysoides]|uniref:FMN dependent NADH:quinone oxidoreductase n=1 Tax=Kineothrix alysoides TaxID=1469948 RepID=A0A4V2QBK0_9FIRM|nr:FMN-dependent NADH-azoreductase [Kineothrix alysoides]TCL56672.1 FMN-dependent NADH-azoreductase [Kineothrix alysoides]